MYAIRPLFKKYGRNVTFFPFDHFTYDTIELGDDVAIGFGVSLYASESSIVIGNKVMLDSNVPINCIWR
jgi:acetyltransferase-like isoleucine patch superfamily enzyme